MHRDSEMWLESLGVCPEERDLYPAVDGVMLAVLLYWRTEHQTVATETGI